MIRKWKVCEEKKLREGFVEREDGRKDCWKWWKEEWRKSGRRSRGRVEEGAEEEWEKE